MTVEQALNRGYNLLVCSFLSIAGFALGSVILDAHDMADRFEDGFVLIVGLVALIWYNIGANRFGHTVVPIVLTVIGLASQIVGVLLELDDEGHLHLGDNTDGVIIFALLLAVAVYQYVRRPVV